ncbi:MAG: TerB N-terminal domain-containing protein [Thermomicrobiales bacterium]
MGIVDWLKKVFAPNPPPRPAKPKRSPARKPPHPAKAPARTAKKPPATGTAPRLSTTAPPFRTRPALPDNARWIGANEQLELRELTIRGGLLYIGERLSAGASGPEPSLIDPSLPVTLPDPVTSDSDLPYWPSYAGIQPHQRGIYLRWLAGGRRDPDIPTGYPFLYLYGIERRLLLDRKAALSIGELPAIRAELAALHATYGAANERFRTACEQMLGLIDLVLVEGAIKDRMRHDAGTIPALAGTLPLPPPLRPENGIPPVSLAIGLGIVALAREPIPADWALAWAWYAPEISVRTPAIRCPDDLASLFAIRYHEHYGDGLILDPAAFDRLEHEVIPFNATIGTQQIEFTILPDVLAHSRRYRPLATMLPAITDELDAYSRWLGRNPDRRGSLAAWAILPDALAGPTSPHAAKASADLTALLGNAPIAAVPGDALLRIWVGNQATLPEKLTKGEASAFATALARLGYGIEPDPRTGTTLTPGATMAIFRLPDGLSTPADTAVPDDGPYAQAAILVQLAAILGEADGAASASEFAAMRDHLHASYTLSPLEERRLGARMVWLASQPASERTLAGMRKRIAPLSPGERDHLARGLLQIVDADGTVAPGEVMTLQKIWKLLGRDPDRVASDLHAVMTGGNLEPTPAVPNPKTASPRRAKPAARTPPPTGDEPVVVRAATPETPRIRIPKPPDANAHPPEPDVALDPGAIARKIADTDAVSALLGDLLAEESATSSSAAPTTTPATTSITPAEISPAALLRALAAQERWTAEAFAALVAQHGMMPNAALDLVNELGFEHAGDPLLLEEPDGALSVDPAVLPDVLEMVSPPNSV